MQVLHERFENDPTVAVLAVHYDDDDDAAAFLAEHGCTYPSITSGGGDIARKFGVHQLPTFVVVGPQGELIDTHVGRLTDEARDAIARKATEAIR